MIKKTILALIMVLSFMGCSSTSKRPEREVTVITNVQEAEVFLNGEYYGRIYGGRLQMRVPKDEVSVVMLKGETGTSNKVIEKEFNDNYLSIYLEQPIKKSAAMQDNTEVSEVKRELDNIKFKESIKQELELERAKERILKLEAKN